MGKESDVYINSRPIPRAKVQKQIRRHDSTTILGRGIPSTSILWKKASFFLAYNVLLGPHPQIPDGFDIRTPVADDVAPISEPQDAISYLPTSPGTVPLVQSQDASLFLPPGLRTNDILLSQLRSSTSSPTLWTGTDGLPFLQFRDGSLASRDFAFSPFEGATNFSRGREHTFNIPFIQLESKLYAEGMSLLHSISFSRLLFHLW